MPRLAALTIEDTFSSEYVELCVTETRDGGVYEWLAEHVWQPGDVWAGDSDGPPLFCWDGDESTGAWSPLVHDSVWIPREGDWLDLLEAVGVNAVTLSRDRSASPWQPSPWFIASEPRHDDPGYAHRLGEASDPLTALARFYLAVRRTQVRGFHVSHLRIITDEGDVRPGPTSRFRSRSWPSSTPSTSASSRTRVLAPDPRKRLINQIHQSQTPIATSHGLLVLDITNSLRLEPRLQDRGQP